VGYDRPELADEPAAVDERGADPNEERHDRHGIFDEVVMQRDDPSRLWISADRRSETTACSTETNPSALVKETRRRPVGPRLEFKQIA
jgi:hypothetical protein